MSTHGHDHDHAHGHDHHHGLAGHHHAPANFGKAFAIGIALNLAYVAGETFYGVVAHSLALLADAGHNLGDVLGLAGAWLASVLGKRQPSGRFTYGLRRSSILAALGNAIVLLVVTGGIAWEGIRRLMDPEPVGGFIILAVAAVGIAVNGVTAYLFMSGRKDDLNIKGAFLHMASDALVALGVVIAGAIIIWTGWLWLDPAISLVISAVIVVGTWSLLRDSVNLALDAVPPGIKPGEVAAFLKEQAGVAEIHDLHIWPMSTTETALTCHCLMPDGHPGDDSRGHYRTAEVDPKQTLRISSTGFADAPKRPSSYRDDFGRRCPKADRSRHMERRHGDHQFLGPRVSPPKFLVVSRRSALPTTYATPSGPTFVVCWQSAGISQ